MLDPSLLQEHISIFKEKGFLLESNGEDYTIKGIGENTLNFIFDYIGSAWNNDAIILLKRNDAVKDILDYYMLTSTKRIVNLENAYGSLENFEMQENGLFSFSIFSADGVIEWGVINTEAQIIIEPIYNEIEFIDDAFIKVYLSRSSVYGFGLYNIYGEQILPAKFEFIDIDLDTEQIMADTPTISFVFNLNGTLLEEIKNDPNSDFYY